MKTNYILGSSHSLFRRYAMWILFIVQLFTYFLAMITPAIFSSGLYLGLISLTSGEGQTVILVATILFSIYIFAFVWAHRFRPFIKPLFFFMMFLNAIGIILILSGYIRQSVAWGFSPDGVSRMIIQWSTIAIILTPFFMAAISLNFTSLWLLIKCSIPYWLFLPTLGEFVCLQVSFF